MSGSSPNTSSGGAGTSQDATFSSMGFGQTPEFREDLERRVHRVRCELATVQSAGAETDHFFFPVNHFKGQVRTHLNHNHVDRIGADVDGGKTHKRESLTIMRSALDS